MDGARGTADEIARELSAGSRRAPWRAAILGSTSEELVAGLDALAAGEPSPALLSGRTRPGATAFMFTGQGAQRPGMGSELYAELPAFAQALDQVCEALDAHLERPLRDVVFAPRGSDGAALLDRTEYTQPALFAIEVALFRVVERCGLIADFLVGHSIGEVTAAHVAGVMSIEDAAALVAARGRLMGALPAGGAMIAVRASEPAVRQSLTEFGSSLDVAAVNAPEAVVVSGDEDAAEAWAARCAEAGVKTTRLRVSHAFHSHHMDPMLEEFRAVARSITYAAPRIPIVSNLTGRVATPEELCSPDHWVRHVREAVRFADGAAHLARTGVTKFLELGPDGVLAQLAGATLGAEGLVLAAALRRKRPELRALMTFLATAHVHGAEVDWEPLLGERRAALQPR